MSQNLILAFPNRIDDVTLSGGSWQASLPRSNLQDRNLGRVARSTTDATADTKFDMDMAVAKMVRVVSLIAHNISTTGQWRIRGSSVSNFATTVYDSGWVDVWPTVYAFGDVPWGEINWWDGKYSDEDRAGYTQTAVHVLPTETYARYWRIEIDDTTNADTYIEIGRVFIGAGWQPTYNASYGATLGWETKTDVQEALSGAETFNRRTPYRVFRFDLPYNTENEVMTKAFELQRRAGVDAEVFAVFDPTDTLHSLRRQFLARLRSLSPVEFPYYRAGRTGFELKEII